MQDAASTAAAQPCSDHEASFPSCGISDANRQKADALFRQAVKLARHGQFEQALDKLKAARAISPLDTVYSTAEQGIRQKVAANQLRQGNQAMQQGDATAALTSFRRAMELDPTNEYALQRLHDALPPTQDFIQQSLFDDMGEIRLTPTPGVHSLESRGLSTAALEKFAGLFGITTIADEGLTPRKVRISLDDVDWETGSQILQKVCKVLIIPLSEREVLIANDTEENRKNLTSMSLRTFYAQGITTPQQLTDLKTALSALFELRFIEVNPAKGTLVIRAPQPTLDGVARFLDDLQDDQPTVMLEIKVFEVSTIFTKDLGISVPNQFSVFNIPSEVEGLLNSSSYQQIIAALTAAGQPINATTILGALLASSSSSSVLSQPFATFGGGLTLSAISVAATNMHFSGTDSLARTVDDILLRSEHGNEATLKVGERYPIVTSQFSASSGVSSLLASFGISAASLTSASAIPTPQFNYEDLGLVLKTTPQVHGKLVGLDYELTLRSLGATQASGPPLLNNRETKGSISTEDGKGVVIAGLMSKGEVASLNGIPLLSAIPVMGKLFSVETKEKTADELLIVITPHVTSARRQRGIYLPVPMNGPK